jgi:DNA-binding beta-propeller fold protein YncE
MKKLFFLILSLVVLFTGCKNGEVNELIVGTYSSYSTTKGKLLFMDMNGKKVKDFNLRGRAYYPLIELNDGYFSALAIASPNRYLVNFSESKDIEIDTIPVTQDYFNGIHVVSYQKNLTLNYIEWNGKEGQKRSKEFEDYLPVLKIEDKVIYVICEYVDENRTVLYSVDINSGNTVWEVELLTPTGHSIEITEDNIFIGSQAGIIVINKDTLQQRKIDLPEDKPFFLHVYKGYIYVFYEDSNTVTKINHTTLTIEENLQLDNRVQTVFFDNDNVYLYSIDKNNSRFITKHNISNFEQVKLVNIPEYKDLYLTNFVIYKK